MVVVPRSFASGPLGSFAEGFAQELARRGYTVNGGEQHLRFVAHLNRWMLAADCDPAGATTPPAAHF